MKFIDIDSFIESKLEVKISGDVHLKEELTVRRFLESEQLNSEFYNLINLEAGETRTDEQKKKFEEVLIGYIKLFFPKMPVELLAKINIDILLNLRETIIKFHNERSEKVGEAFNGNNGKKQKKREKAISSL